MEPLNESQGYRPEGQHPNAPEHYGLEPIDLDAFKITGKRLSKQESKKLATPSQKNEKEARFPWKFLSILLIIVILSISCLEYFGMVEIVANNGFKRWVDQQVNALSSVFKTNELTQSSNTRKESVMRPFKIDSATTLIKDSTMALSGKEIDTVKKNNPIERIKEEKTFPFQIIIGSFNELKKANDFIEAQTKKGNKSFLLESSEAGKYRVSAAGFEDKEIAKKKLDSIKQIYSGAPWILSINKK